MGMLFRRCFSQYSSDGVRCPRTPFLPTTLLYASSTLLYNDVPRINKSSCALPSAKTGSRHLPPRDTISCTLSVKNFSRSCHSHEPLALSLILSHTLSHTHTLSLSYSLPLSHINTHIFSSTSSLSSGCSYLARLMNLNAIGAFDDQHIRIDGRRLSRHEMSGYWT